MGSSHALHLSRNHLRTARMRVPEVADVCLGLPLSAVMIVNLSGPPEGTDYHDSCPQTSLIWAVCRTAAPSTMREHLPPQSRSGYPLYTARDDSSSSSRRDRTRATRIPH